MSNEPGGEGQGPRPELPYKDGFEPASPLSLGDKSYENEWLKPGRLGSRIPTSPEPMGAKPEGAERLTDDEWRQKMHELWLASSRFDFPGGGKYEARPPRFMEYLRLHKPGVKETVIDWISNLIRKAPKL